MLSRTVHPLRSLPAAVLLLALVAALPLRAQEPEPSGRGVLLFGPAGDAPAGGDLLLSWRRGPEGPQGALSAPFDLALALVEEQPRGGFSVELVRAGERSWVAWPSASKGLHPGLPLSGEAAEAQSEAVRLLLQKDGAAVPLLEALALREEIEPRSRAFCLSQAVQLLRRLGKPERLVELLDRALAVLPAGTRPERAFLLDAKALALEQRGDLETAERLYREAAELRGGLEAMSLGVARDLTSLGRIAWTRGDLPAARSHFEAALAVRSELAPGSLDETDSLNDVAIVAWRLGDLEGAKARLTTCLAVQRAVAPESPEVARSLSNLGLVAFQQGDLATAQAHFEASSAIRERLLPNHPDTAQGLHNLGVALWKRGELARSEVYLRRALEIERGLAPKSLGVAQSLISLAVLALERAESDEAWELALGAVAMYEAVAPESLDLAEGLESAAQIAGTRGEVDEAARLSARSLSLRTRLAPGSPQEAMGWAAEGDLRLQRGEPAAAAEAFAAALAIWDRLAPDSTTRASCLTRRGVALLAAGDSDRAEPLLRDALALASRLLPGGIEEAEAAHALGLLLRDAGRREAALPHFLRAVECLDACTEKAGESEAGRSGFRSRFQEYYTDAIDLLVEAGRPAEGFAVLERSRARGMLEILAGRDLDFRGELPEKLDGERRLLAARGAALREELRDAETQSGEGESAAIRNELRALELRREAIVREIREASPRLASLLAPRPLDLSGAQASLPKGTLLLAYSIGERRSILFALGPGRGEFTAQALPLGRGALERRVRRLRGLVVDGLGGEEAAAALGRDLLGRAAGSLGRANRLVVCPDGPLHALPFALLQLPQGPGKRRRLPELVPVTTALSASVYAELRAVERRASGRVAAFGDPAYPVGGGWVRLPYAREEIRSLQGLYGGGARVFTGDAATEARVHEVAAEAAASLHFACHAFADDRFPLDSGLALTPLPAEGGDGVLRAFEVLESVRVGADRVVLSACSTGLGRRVGGEGTVGLVRAFHFAGARTVVATLWPVSDAASCELMRRFYLHLKRGRTAEESLRRAQVELLSGVAGEAFQVPAAWASFQLYGDGR